MPALKLDNRTTTNACAVALRSASISSYTTGSSAIAPMRRITKLVRAPVVVGISELYARTTAQGTAKAVPYESGALLGLSFDDLVDSRHVERVDTWTVNRRVVRFVRRHVDALRGIGRRHLLIVQRGRLLPEVAQVRLEPVDSLL